MTPTPLAYSIRDACAVSSLSRSSIYLRIAEGRLRAVKVCGRTVIPAESLKALLEGRTE